MRKRLIYIPIAFILVIVGFRTYNKFENYKLQKELSSQIIRFHVRANSDSGEDQALKLKVRDGVIDFLHDKLANVNSLDEARNILYYGKDEIQAIAKQTVMDNGYDYPVSVYFEKTYFPMKTYGDMVFPAGKYEAFRVDIGEHEGRNWWCVLFPPLCFVDSTYAIVPDSTKEQFHSVLSDDAYSAITMSDLDNNYEIRFKYLKFLNKFLE